MVFGADKKLVPALDSASSQDQIGSGQQFRGINSYGNMVVGANG